MGLTPYIIGIVVCCVIAGILVHIASCLRAEKQHDAKLLHDRTETEFGKVDCSIKYEDRKDCYILKKTSTFGIYFKCPLDGKRALKGVDCSECRCGLYDTRALYVRQACDMLEEYTDSKARDMIDKFTEDMNK